VRALWALRSIAVVMAVLLTGTTINVPAASAITPPSVDPALVPPDGIPKPEQPMRQSNECAHAIAATQQDV